MTQCSEPRTCAIRDSCPYVRIFEPTSAISAPSGLADPPRPFVFRAAHLDGRTVGRGSQFHFDVHLFDLDETVIAYFIVTFAQLAREGLGPGRAPTSLTAVEQLDVSGHKVRQIFDGSVILSTAPLEPCCVSLDPAPVPLRRVRVRFVTPMELKSGHQLAERPDFGILLARIRDRIGTLGDLYGATRLHMMDFAAFGRRAETVAMTRCELAHETVTRFSTRTRQTHPLGGFVGVAEYAGELAVFMPFLLAAQFAGVGRQTTWGKGEIAVLTLEQ